MSQTASIQALIGQAVRSELPAAQLIQGFLKANPGMGSKDRLRVSDGFWQALREAPIPEWLADELRSAVGDDEFEALVACLAQPGMLDLRVNLVKCRPEQALTALHAEGICVEASSVMAEALHVDGKPNIEKSKAYQRGMVEVQDLGSQLLARLVQPKRGQLIVDFCAGAGGKTLALASALRGTGKVFALDISSARLARLSPRLERSSLPNVWPMTISSLKDARLSTLRQKADAVLVDAPCSGTGTLRRSPDLKWRLNKDKLGQFTAQQLEILQAAASLVRPGGRLVYATCSLLPSENAAVVDQFLSEHPQAHRVSAQETLLSQRILLPQAWGAWSKSGDLQLWPHRSGTDGFYAAVLCLGASAKQAGLG